MEATSFSSSFLPGHSDIRPTMRESWPSVEGSPAFTLQASYQCCSSSSSCHTPSKSSSTPSPFLQHVIASSDVSRLCVSSSSRSLLLFDPRTFQPVDTRHEAHASQITEITFLSSSPSLLVSSSQDGCLRLWDFRLSSCTSPCVGAIRLAPAGSKEAEVWSVAVNSSDRLIAGGCKSSFFLFDLRKSFSSSFSSSSNQVSYFDSPTTGLWNAHMQAPLSSASSDQSTVVKRGGKKKNKPHKERTTEVGLQQALARIEVHSDTVTCLLFHPWLESILFSGGEDHLVCIHDVSLKKDKGVDSSSSSFLRGGAEATNGTNTLTPNALHEAEEEEEEEDGELTMVSCFSHGRPVKKISILGPQDDCLCVASPMEDIALWQLAGLSGGRHSNGSRFPMKDSTLGCEAEAEDSACMNMEAQTGCPTDSSFHEKMMTGRSTDPHPDSTTDSSMSSRSPGEDKEVRKTHGAGEVRHIEKKADWLSLRHQPSLVCGESGGYLVDSFYDGGSGRLFFLAGKHAS